MNLPVGRQRLVLFAVLGLVLAVGIGGVVYWQTSKKSNQSTQANEEFRKYFQGKRQQVIKNSDERNAANKKEYESVAGITTKEQFEKKFPAGEREAKALITLKHMINGSKNAEALTFAAYIEATYPKVAGNIDFMIYAYNAAKAMNKPDLMTKYKEATVAFLRSTGSLKPNESLSDDYFSGVGQSE